MKETDFLNDWWSGTQHTSNPSFQDAIDWAERRHLEEIREVRQKRDIIYEIKMQFLIEFACKELENLIDNTATEVFARGVGEGTDIVNKFRKEMEEYMNYA